MDFLKKNKIIVGAIVLIIIVLGGAWFFVVRKNGISPQGNQVVDQTQNVKKISADDIGLTLTLKPDKKNVVLGLSKLSGIKTFEYELSYDADETFDGETNVVSKGASSSDPIAINGQSDIEREILLGTCSAKVCRYDIVKSDIKAVVTVTYNNGDVAAAETSIPYK